MCEDSLSEAYDFEIVKTEEEGCQKYNRISEIR